jgi:NAD(P)-dependent dehydrogenase (short-subunit alcohol dehydrogenase family)
MAAIPFQNAVAVVTGGASGLGRALCEELARRGVVVMVTDLQEEGAHAVAAGIVAAGGRASGAALDVRDAPAFERLLDDTIAAHGRLDYLFNNAGLATAGEAQNLPLDVWRKVLDVNLWGVIQAPRRPTRGWSARARAHRQRRLGGGAGRDGARVALRHEQVRCRGSLPHPAFGGGRISASR